MLMATRKGISTPRRKDPTPDEIAACCRQIQAGWSEKMRAARRVTKGAEIPWTVPECELAEDAPDEQEFWFWLI